VTIVNQVPPLEPCNLFDTDPVLHQAIVREGAASAVDSIRSFGERVGSAEVSQWGFEANHQTSNTLLV